MKDTFGFILFLLTIGAIAVLAIVYKCDYNRVALKIDIEKLRTEFRAEIDSVLKNQDSIKNEIRAVKSNTDTLKAGQEVIFRTMNENKGRNIFDFLNF